MRKKQRVSAQSNNFKLVLLFICAVVFLIVLSLAVRIFTIVKNSKFDGTHAFNIAIYRENDVLLTSILPDTHSVSMLTLKGVLHKPAGQLLGIPVDGQITTTSQATEKTLSSHLESVILHANRHSSDLTLFDAIRLYFFAKGVQSRNVVMHELSLPQDINALDNIAISLFADEAIASEKVSVGIINSTSATGLGNRLARVITNIGGNVVSVSSDDENSKKTSVFYYGEKSYTVTRLGKILGVEPTQTQTQGISDVTVVIGEDNLSNKSF